LLCHRCLAWGRHCLADRLAAVILGTVTAMAPMLARGEIKVVPSIAVTERYDNNVFSTSGGKSEDYVTSLSPRVTVVSKDRPVEGIAQVGVTGLKYVKHSELDTVAADGSLNLNLDQVVKRIVPRAGLTVTDNILFTPEVEAFQTPATTVQPLAPAPGGLFPDAFARGIQPTRANFFANSGSVTGSYALSPTVYAQATYVNQFSRFGKSFGAVTGGGSFFNTTSQSVYMGPSWRVSPLDNLYLNYQYSKAEFDNAGGFATHGGTVGWGRTLLPAYTTNLAIGVNGIEGSNKLAYTGDVSIRWRYSQNTSTSLSYSRAVVPSFFTAGLPLVSQVATVSVSQRLAELLTATGSASYAHSESTVTGTTATGVLLFQSYAASLGLDYSITRLLTASLSSNFGEFKQSFLGSKTTVDKNQVMLTLRAEWK
jgi:hypothetical protein